MKKTLALALLSLLLSSCAAVTAPDRLDCPRQRASCVIKYSVLDTLTLGISKAIRTHQQLKRNDDGS